MGDIVVSADTRDLIDLGRRLKQMDKPIQRAIRKTLTAETGKVVKAIRAEVLSIPTKSDQGTSPYRVKRHRKNFIGPLEAVVERNVRQKIAQGVRSVIRYGNAKGQASISVIGSSHYLPPDKKVMNKLLNYPSWRHPVYGNRNVFVEQKGHPFWAKTTNRFTESIHNALAQAVEQSIIEELKNKPIGM